MLLSSKKIAELEAKIVEQNELLETNTASFEEKNAKIAELELFEKAVAERESQISELTAQVKTAVEANGKAADEISELTTKLEAAQKDVESKISDGIVKGLAEAGVEPIARDPNAPDADADTKPARNETLKGFDRILAATKAMIAPRN